jgi:DNA invertase Pin-like site-specific DNA recombinase
MITRAAVYGRTGPGCALSAEQQIGHLRAVATQRGWVVIQEFTDKPTSVRRDNRPGEVALSRAMANAESDRVLIWSIDRIGRTSGELVRFLEACRTAQVAVWLHEQRIDTATTNATSLLDFAELLTLHQRQVRREQILRGLATARSLSIRLGRPSISSTKVEKAKALLSAGAGVRETARLTGGISAASVCRIKAQMTSAVGSA